jgi:hypothetical protein
MRLGARRLSSWVAIYVIAAQAVLTAFAPAFAAARPAAFDPFTITCLTMAADKAAADTTPGLPDAAPGQACDHSILCGMVSAAAPPSTAAFVAFRRGLVTRPLVPASEAPPAVAVFNPTSARGPPRSA